MISKMKAAGAVLSLVFLAACTPVMETPAGSVTPAPEAAEVPTIPPERIVASHAASAPEAEEVPDDPVDYEFRIKRVVRLSGDITRASAVEVIQHLQYLDENNPDNRDITLIINSPGGEVEPGLAIYDTIRNLKSDVRTVCEGRAMSMAAVLLAAGTAGKRTSLADCSIMLHEISAGQEGKISNLAVQFKEIARLNGMMMDILSRHLNRKKEDVSSALSQDYYMNPEEARAIGVIDTIRNSPRAPLPPGTRPMPARRVQAS